MNDRLIKDRFECLGLVKDPNTGQLTNGHITLEGYDAESSTYAYFDDGNSFQNICFEVEVNADNHENVILFQKDGPSNLFGLDITTGGTFYNVRIFYSVGSDTIVKGKSTISKNTWYPVCINYASSTGAIQFQWNDEAWINATAQSTGNLERISVDPYYGNIGTNQDLLLDDLNIDDTGYSVTINSPEENDVINIYDVTPSASGSYVSSTTRPEIELTITNDALTFLKFVKVESVFDNQWYGTIGNLPVDNYNISATEMLANDCYNSQWQWLYPNCNPTILATSATRNFTVIYSSTSSLMSQFDLRNLDINLSSTMININIKTTKIQEKIDKYVVAKISLTLFWFSFLTYFFII